MRTIHIAALSIAIALTSCDAPKQMPPTIQPAQQETQPDTRVATRVKDLTGAHIARITPETRGVKSILGNAFIEARQPNTVGTVAYFRSLKPDAPMGDRNIPLSNFKHFIGVVDGRLKVDTLKNFDGADVVTPVANITEMAYELRRQTAQEVVTLAKRARMWRETPPDGAPAAADSARKYDNLSSTQVGYVNRRGLFIPSAGLQMGKSLLVARNGNAVFINNLRALSPSQDSLINAFISRNGGAMPVQLDNGMFAHYLEGDSATYEKYMSVDVPREAETVWVFGEVE